MSICLYMTDYSKTIIYKIEHLHNKSLLYLGQTTNFTNRKHKHKSCCNKPEMYNVKLYKMMRENGGWECFKVEKTK